MCHAIVGDASFYELLYRMDGEIAAQARAAGCPRCGGVLHSARYPRKPRGSGCALGATYESRLSLCCSSEGCRRRVTPPSLRFLGRRVYLGAVVVVATALRHGLTPVRAGKLRELFGVSHRTLVRWRRWWLESFTASSFWKTARAGFSRPVTEERLPAALVERFAGDPCQGLVATLRFLSPLSTSS